MASEGTPTRELSDDDLLAQFEGASLPFQQWTHHAHVRIAVLYLSRLPFDEALARMRRGIQRYNAAHDVPKGPESGYHETLTVAFMRLIEDARRSDPAHRPDRSSAAFCNRHSHLLRKSIVLDFYTRERLMSGEAKRSFIEPDIAPLP